MGVPDLGFPFPTPIILACLTFDKLNPFSDSIVAFELARYAWTCLLRSAVLKLRRRNSWRETSIGADKTEVSSLLLKRMMTKDSVPSLDGWHAVPELEPRYK